jgi:peptidoglycan/xylan/chitin deacetylase (PgdA/CDA1 family)
MSITRGEFLRSLGKSLPGMVASTGMATAVEALIRRIAQAAPPPVEPAGKPGEAVPFFEHGAGEKNQIALTFDDGPVPGVTEIILEELRKREVRATFFMIGEKAAAAPDLARRVLDEGHEIGNHTFSHSKLSELPDKAAEEEIEKTENLFSELFGYKAAWFRPPYGALRQNQAALATNRKLGVALWSIDSEDWRRPGESQIAKNVLTKTKAGSIILCHELSQTAGCLEKIFDGLEKGQFRPVTISSLLGSSL